ncbi:MAG: DUF5615 family PIN-like protein [Chloroflexi bacterium]|nr:DUF5615 family PIN-like protein [Chloroflexota bacterium]
MRLEARGFQVRTTRAAGMLGAEDGEQLAYATRYDLLILSHNKRHFQNWHRTYQAQGREHGGIVLLPRTILEVLELRAAMMFDWVGTLPLYRSQCLLWNDLQQKLILGLRLEGYSEAEIATVLGRSPP